MVILGLLTLLTRFIVISGTVDQDAIEYFFYVTTWYILSYDHAKVWQCQQLFLLAPRHFYPRAQKNMAVAKKSTKARAEPPQNWLTTWVKRIGFLGILITTLGWLDSIKVRPYFFWTYTFVLILNLRDLGPLVCFRTSFLARACAGSHCLFTQRHRWHDHTYRHESHRNIPW